MKYRYSLRRQLACLLVLVINAAIVPAYSMPAPAGDRRSPSSAQPDRSLVNDGKREKIKQGLFGMPLAFEANCGQAPRNVQFTAEAGGRCISISHAATVFTLFQEHNSDQGLRKEASDGSSDHSGTPQSQIRATEQAVVRMRLAGANLQARPQGLDLLAGRSNYFLGNDPARWHTDVPMYSRVKEENVYPGVDLIYHGNGQHLEYDFVIASGGDPRSIKMDFDGARKLSVNSEGSLIVTTDAGEIRQQKPFAYQENSGVTNEIASRYVIKGKRRVEFRVGEYDRSRTLVIDPVLAYSTYFGQGQTQAMGIAVDSAGNAYVLGKSLPTSVEVTPGAFQTASGQPIFVLKLNPAGNAVVYLSRFGGDSDTRGLGIALDPEGNVFITGDTISDDYPTTAGAFQPKPKGSGDAFVTKLNPAGSALVYSTLIGGGANDSAVSIAIDSAGDAFIGGSTRSNDFPTTAGAFRASLPHKTPGTPPDGVAGTAGFIAKLNPAGSALVYSTYLGGEGNDSVSGLAVDSAGNAYVAGGTNSSDFPTTAGALKESPSIGFVAKLSANGSALAYSALTAAAPSAIALDSSGNAYFAGLTFNDIPTVNAFQSRRGNGPVVKSLDGGNSWSLMDSGLPENVSPGIAIDPKAPSTLYAFASSAGQPSIFKSMNAGGSWDPSATGLPAGAFIHALAIDPVNPANLYLTAAPPNFQGFTTTVYVSTNSGSSWSPTSLNFPVNDGFVAIDPHTPSTVYAGYNGQRGTGSGAIFRSNDGGAHWQQLTNGLTNIDANALAIDPQNPSTLYLGTDQGLFKSSDRGDSWSATIVTRPVQCLAIDPQTTSTVYAGTPFALTQLEAEGRGNPRRRVGQGDLPLIGIIRSPNGGADWAPMNIGLEFQALAPNYLLIDPKNPSTIYTSVRGGLFKTVDAGVNWTGPIGSQGVVGAIDPVNTLTLYAGSLKQQNAFVRKLNPQGSALVYSTYLGGLNFDEARGIAVDSQGNAYVGGITSSPNFPTTSGSFQLHLRGTGNVFVTELSASGTSLGFSTYLGGTRQDSLNVVGGSNGLALDSEGNVYVAGTTSSSDFPTASPLQASLVTPPGQRDVQNAFITKIDPSRQSTEPPPTPEALNTAKILSVTADGKNLQVEGLHFYEGSIIIVDGVPQNTLNDFTNLNTLLTGKKTAKRIPRGMSVMIQVQNLNGTTSDPFPFVRAR